MIVLEIFEKPIGKQRPKINTYTKRAYTPKKTRDYEETIKQTFINKYKNLEISTKKMKARITAFFEIPKSYSLKKKRMLLGQAYSHKPDADNIAKMILDSLNGLAYKDDAQIVVLEVQKYYGTKSKVVLELEELKEEE